jgi:hypothetical protein
VVGNEEGITMTNYDETVDSYLAIWNETDSDSRAKLIAQAMAADVYYLDPMAEASGAEMLDATIGAVQQQFPGWSFRQVGTLDGHHNLVRFTWELGPDGVEAPIVGFDVAVLNPDGRVQTVHGFLDRVPTG